MGEAVTFKEEGNKYFNEGNFGEASSFYTKALSVKSISDSEKAVFLKNRAACFLKLQKYHEAAADCTAALEVCPIDTKALFRRCQALEQLGQFEEAYKDARKLVQVEPKNVAIQPILRRLHIVIQDKLAKHMSTDNQVIQMFDLTFKNTSGDEEKRKQAANNLIVLAREQSGAEKIFQSNGITKLLLLLETEKDKDLQLTAIRVLSCLSNDSASRSQAILEQMTLRKVLLYIGNESEKISTAMAFMLQNIINSITNLDYIKKEREKYEAKRAADPAARMRPFPFCVEKIDADAIEMIDTMLAPVIQLLGSNKLSGFGRDNMLELLIKFVTRKDGIGWSKKFIEAGGIQQLLTIAGTIAEHKTISVTQNSRMHVSLCLSKIYDDLVSDQERTLFSDATEAYFTDFFRDDIMESKLEAIMALAALLQVSSGTPVLQLHRQYIVVYYIQD
jgi:protein unc-45